MFPSERAVNVTIQYYDSGRVVGFLSAPQAINMDETNNQIILPQGFYLEFFVGDTLKITIRGQMGRYDGDARIVTAKGDVNVYTDDGRYLKTEELTFRMDERMFYSPTYIQMKTKREFLSGKGLKASADFTEYEIGELTGRVFIDINEGKGKGS